MKPNLVQLTDDELTLHMALVLANKAEPAAEHNVGWVNYHMRKAQYTGVEDFRFRSGLQTDVLQHLPLAFCPNVRLRWSNRAYLAIRSIMHNVHNDLGEDGLLQLLSAVVLLREEKEANELARRDRVTTRTNGN